MGYHVQPLLERAELVVGFHAQGLENLSCGVATPMPAHNFLNRPGQRECLTKWRGLALLHKRTGDATRGRFLAETAKKSGQLVVAVTRAARTRGLERGSSHRPAKRPG